MRDNSRPDVRPTGAMHITGDFGQAAVRHAGEQQGVPEAAGLPAHGGIPEGFIMVGEKSYAVGVDRAASSN